MKYSFNIELSKIIDFLIYPGVINLWNNIKDKEKSYNMELYGEDIARMEKNLEPFIVDIEKYYLESTSFINLIIRQKDLFEMKSIDEVFDFAMSLTDEELELRIIRGIIGIHENIDIEDNEEINEKALDVMEGKKFTELINSHSIGAKDKWNLLMYLSKPRESLIEYIEFMRKIENIFEEEYKIHYDEIIAEGEKVLEIISDDREDGLKKLSNDRVNMKMLEEEDFHETIILITFTNPGVLTIYANEKINYIVGIKFRKVMEALREGEIDKQKERVDAFKVLGDRTRYETLILISEGITSTQEIARRLDVSSATISYHLNTLMSNRLIEFETRDENYRYRVNEDFIIELVDGLKMDILNKKL